MIFLPPIVGGFEQVFLLLFLFFPLSSKTTTMIFRSALFVLFATTTASARVNDATISDRLLAAGDAQADRELAARPSCCSTDKCFYYHTPSYAQCAPKGASDECPGSMKDCDPICENTNRGGGYDSGCTDKKKKICVDDSGVEPDFQEDGAECVRCVRKEHPNPNKDFDIGCWAGKPLCVLEDGETEPAPGKKGYKCVKSCVDTSLTLLTDGWGDETSWVLEDSSGTLDEASVGSYADDTEYNVDFGCLDRIDCYEFTVFDSFGDGGASWSIDFGGDTFAGAFDGGSSEGADFGNCDTRRLQDEND